jgi:glycosyltransferase involved in cell wall biosynthesis
MHFNKKRIVFISQLITQPRIHRRLQSLRDAGFELQVYATDRKRFQVNEFPEGIPLKNLGVFDDNYIKRIPKILSIIKEVRRAEKNNRIDGIYMFGFDSAIIGNSLGRKNAKKMYEISDLRFTKNQKSLMSKVFCFIEDRFIKNTDLLIMTSPWFLDEYKTRVKHIENITRIFENKLPQDFYTDNGRNISEREEGIIKIGFVGFIRYLNVIEPFMQEIAKKGDKFEFHLYGDGDEKDINTVKDYAKKHGNIIYHGPYKNPDELEEVYHSIDLTCSIYDSNHFNVKVLSPNKLFESIYFCSPIIVADNTRLGERVNDWNVGFSVDVQSKQAVGEFLDNLSWEKVKEKRNSCLKYDPKNLVFDENRFLTDVKNIFTEHE